MTAVTIGQNIDQNRTALLLFENLLFATVCVDYSQRVVTVHTFCMHLLGVDTGTDTGCKIEAHRLTAGLTTHTVLVVHDVDDDRQTALHITFPKLFELIHGSEGHTFPYRTAGH